jgi:hypothetical protein
MWISLDNNLIFTRLAYMNIEITTHSRPDAFPSALRQKLRTTQTKVHHAGEETRTKVFISLRNKHSQLT